MSFLKIIRLGIISTRYYSVPFKNTPPILTLKTEPYYDNHKRNYKNFGHKPEKETTLSKVYYSVLLIMFIIPTLNYKW